MSHDVHEPVAYYQSALEQAHLQNTSAFFEDLVSKSGVDEERNSATVREIRKLEKLLAEASTSSGLWKALRIALYVAAVAFLYWAITWHPAWAVGIAVIAAVVLFKLNPRIQVIDDQRGQLKAERDRLESEAWQQMEPLNRLYDWADFAALAHKTFPQIELDPYCTNVRLDHLHQTYGWNDHFNDDRAVCFAHSGQSSGNPFMLGQTVRHWMGTKTYEGSLSISWTERERRADGKWVTVTRNETLQASVTKPFPEFADETVLIYGNQMAPSLSFSREPSSLSGLDDGILSNWRKSLAIKRLEAKARNIDNKFTVMANREFDSLFGATDRDNEVQFRLLFTPLAQQEMVNLLKDRKIGYGDRFCFRKSMMINLIEPAWMYGKNISSDPGLFRHYEIEQARTTFNAYHNDLFKAVYFCFAPLLSIPLYQQHRPQGDIDKDILQGVSCFWEHEAIAYFMGEDTFRHPESITRNILKTKAALESDGAQIAEVSAYGYRGVQRVDYISVRGEDGNDHKVPVEWIEYIPVVRVSQILLHDQRSDTREEHSAKWRLAFQSRGIPAEQAILRRSIAAAVLS